jgi:hypothetical protein
MKLGNYLNKTFGKAYILNLKSQKERKDLVKKNCDEINLDYKFVDGRLIINFSNGSVYEYISVPKATYVKMVNADSPTRFAKRHILNAFTWRKTTNQD